MWVAKGAKSLSSKSNGVNYQSSKQYNSSAFDFRRIALRQQWKLSPKSDADVFTYPNERLGNCYDLNWALCALKVIPVHNAYRNLHIRGLQMLSESTTDASKAVKVTVEEPAEHSFYFVGESAFSGANLDTEGFKYLLRDVRKYLSDSEHIFTHDGAVGSHASSEVTLRTISNNANSALFLKHALHKVPLRNPKSFEANFTVFIVPKFSLKKGLYGITSPNFTAIDTTNKRIVVAGTQSFSALQKSLLTLTTPHFVSNNILPVAADVILTNGNRNVLVFSDSGSLSQNGVSNVFSASNSLWAPSSVTRAFNSANLNHIPSNITRGDLVNTVGKEVTVTKTFSPEAGNILGHPFAVAFVVNSKDASSPSFATLSKEQAKTLFKQSVARSLPNYNSDALSAAFEERLDSLNIPAVLVTGTTSNASVAQKIQSLSQSIPSEKVPGNLFTN